MATSFGTHDAPNLLTYLPDFSVLICRSCQFAIQPSALPSHLLRHRIYRTERQQLLQELSALALVEPEDVRSPSPQSAPLRDLPVHRGYRCLAVDCSHACASQKRMSQHWSEAHGERDSKMVRAQQAYLQTFFKGNKILYFEVNGSEGAPPSGTTSPTLPRPTLRPTGSMDVQSPRLSLTPLSPWEASSENSGENEIEWTPILNIDELRYLHQYTVSTGHTLRRGNDESLDFWVREIPNEAFKYPFLMHGLLGLASFHMSCEATTPADASRHHDASLRYQSAGMADFRAAMQMPNTENSVALVAFARIIGIQRFTSPPLVDPTFGAHVTPDGLAAVMEFLRLIRGTVETLVSLQHLLPEESEFTLSEENLHPLQYNHDLRATDQNAFRAIPPSLLHRLENLPRRLVTMMPTPLEDPETNSIMSATAVLITSFSRSCARPDARALWDGIETWPRHLSDHYIRMLEAGHPAALVVFAHWCILLQRGEQHYWYLRGQPERLLWITAAHLQGDAREMVMELLTSG